MNQNTHNNPVLIDPDAKASSDAVTRFVKEKMAESFSRVASQNGLIDRLEQLGYHEQAQMEYKRLQEVRSAEQEYRRQIQNNPVAAFKAFQAQMRD